MLEVINGTSHIRQTASGGMTQGAIRRGAGLLWSATGTVMAGETGESSTR